MIKKFMPSFVVMISLCNILYCQKKDWTDIGVDAIPFNKDSLKLERVINQDGVTLQVFYCQNKHSKYYKTLCVIKNDNGKSSVILKMLYNYDLFNFEDINNDGYIDFCGTYHFFYIVHFYDKNTKSFHIKTDAWLPIERKLIDKERNIYCDSYGPLYGYKYNESALYSFDGLKVKWLNNIVFVDKEEFSDENIIETKLYKYKNFDVRNPIFIKTIDFKDDMHYSSWWKKHYKQLLNIK